MAPPYADDGDKRPREDDDDDALLLRPPRLLLRSRSAMTVPVAKRRCTSRIGFERQLDHLVKRFLGHRLMDYKGTLPNYHGFNNTIKCTSPATATLSLNMQSSLIKHTHRMTFYGTSLSTMLSAQNKPRTWNWNSQSFRTRCVSLFLLCHQQQRGNCNFIREIIPNSVNSLSPFSSGRCKSRLFRFSSSLSSFASHPPLIVIRRSVLQSVDSVRKLLGR